MKRFLYDSLRRNPYPVYAMMRRASPILHNRVHNFWMLFDFDGVKQALSDHHSFGSRVAPPGGKPLDWLIFQDPPVHTKLRGLIMRTFTPRAISGLEPRVIRLANELLDRPVERGTMDVAREYSIPLPITVISEMLGIPVADRARFLRWSEAILGLGAAAAGGERAAKAIARYGEAKEEMRPYVAELLARRRSHPADDLLTRLAESQVDGERLSDEEILSFFQLLILAGSETTTNLIGNALLCFLEHPAQLARIRKDPALLPQTIEEVLRYRSPVQLVFRTTRRAVKLRGRTIPEGQLLLAMIGSANRDPTRFVHADRFDIDRAPTSHVAFGHGIHFCIGAALARLEARVALQLLLDRIHDIERTGAWKPQPAPNVYGPASLQIRFTPAG